MDKLRPKLAFALLVAFLSEIAYIRIAHSVRVSAASSTASLFPADCAQLQPLFDPALDSGLEYNTNSAESFFDVDADVLSTQSLPNLQGSPSHSRLGPELSGRPQPQPKPPVTEVRAVRDGNGNTGDRQQNKQQQQQEEASITAYGIGSTSASDPNPPLSNAQSQIDVSQCEDEVARDREGSSFGSRAVAEGESDVPLHIGMLHDNDLEASAAARLAICHANRIALLPRPFRLHILLNNSRVRGSLTRVQHMHCVEFFLISTKADRSRPIG